MQRSVNIRSRIHLQGTFWYIFLSKAKLFDIFQATSLLIAFTLEFLFYHLKWKSSSTWFRSRAFQFCAKKIFVFFYKKLVLKLSFMIVKKEGNTVPKTGPKSLILPFYNFTSIYSVWRKTLRKFFFCLENSFEFFETVISSNQFLFNKNSFAVFASYIWTVWLISLNIFWFFDRTVAKKSKEFLRQKKNQNSVNEKPLFLTTRWDFSKDNFKL